MWRTKILHSIDPSGFCPQHRPLAGTTASGIPTSSYYPSTLSLGFDIEPMSFIYGPYPLVTVKELLMASVEPILTLPAVASSRRLVVAVVVVALSISLRTEIDIALFWNAINS